MGFVALGLGGGLGCNAILDNPEGRLVRAQAGAAGDGGSQAGEGGAGSGGTAGAAAGGGGVGTDPTCGNGLVEAPERCDDDNEQPGDGCSTSCRIETGFTCDAGEPTSCDENCGDGRLVGAEAKAGGCDDDNDQPGDGCSASCTVENDWFCSGAPSTCSRTCGNGEIEGSEGCDDGNSADGDGCFACATETGFACSDEPSRCTTTCGDGTRASSEECDDGNTTLEACAYGVESCSVCDPSCFLVSGQLHLCGDGITDQPDESCDDGGVTSGDGCTSRCATESGWACRGTPSTCHRSCLDVDPTCGPDQNDDCCASTVVPGGTFDRGNDGDYPATVSTFRLDTYEITVGRFRKFVAAYAAGFRPSPGSGANPNNAADPGWDSAWPLPADAAALTGSGTGGVQCSADFQTYSTSPGTIESESRPQNCLTWYVASAFCIWDGGRLPTEAEWNFAAAGGEEQRLYPWGSSVPGDDAELAVYGCFYNGSGTCTDVQNIARVGSLSAGLGRWGHADLAGNLWEWAQDWHRVPYSDTECVDCADLSAAVARVLRGGGYQLAESDLRTSSRFGYAPIDRDSLFGARCARAP